MGSIHSFCWMDVLVYVGFSWVIDGRSFKEYSWRKIVEHVEEK